MNKMLSLVLQTLSLLISEKATEVKKIIELFDAASGGLTRVRISQFQALVPREVENYYKVSFIVDELFKVVVVKVVEELGDF